jgi:integrase
MHPSLKHSLQEWRSQSLYNKPEDFVFPSERLQGVKPLDLASVLKKKIQPAFRRIGITGVGGHTFRHSVGTMLAEMGEHQLTIRDTCGTATFMSRTSTCRQHRRPNLGAAQIGRRDFADGSFAEDKPNPMSAVWNRSWMGPFSFGAYRPLTSPDLPDARVASA